MGYWAPLQRYGDEAPGWASGSIHAGPVRRAGPGIKKPLSLFSGVSASPFLPAESQLLDVALRRVLGRGKALHPRAPRPSGPRRGIGWHRGRCGEEVSSRGKGGGGGRRGRRWGPGRGCEPPGRTACAPRVSQGSPRSWRRAGLRARNAAPTALCPSRFQRGAARGRILQAQTSRPEDGDSPGLYAGERDPPCPCPSPPPLLLQVVRAIAPRARTRTHRHTSPHCPPRSRAHRKSMPSL